MNWFTHWCLNCYNFVNFLKIQKKLTYLKRPILLEVYEFDLRCVLQMNKGNLKEELSLKSGQKKFWRIRWNQNLRLEVLKTNFRKKEEISK